MAAAHSQSVTTYHMPRDGTAYKDPGGDHFDDPRETRRETRRAKHFVFVKGSERPGYRATIEKAE